MDGPWASLYPGSKLVYRLPFHGMKGLFLTGLARWNGDVCVPGGHDRRRPWFGSLKATYDLNAGKVATVRPSLFLARQRKDMLNDKAWNPGSNCAYQAFG